MPRRRHAPLSASAIVLPPLQDVRYALRSLRTSPAFTALAVITLGLGIGANAAMFVVLDRLLFRSPAHVADAARVVRLDLQARTGGGRAVRYPVLSYAQYAYFRDRARSLASVAAYAPDARILSLGMGEQARAVRGRMVTASFFSVLGVHPALGRFFAPDEEPIGNAAHLVVLSHEFWERQFGGARAVLGSAIDIGGSTYLVVGVAPAGFGGIDLDVPDIWLPIAASASQLVGAMALGPNAAWLEAIGRLRPGVTDSAAAVEATAIVRQEARERGVGAAIRASFGSVREVTDASAAAPQGLALWLTTACGMLLLIACANVTGLLLARGAQRRREIAIRLALGASRAAVARRLLTEMLILAALGAGAALLVASWAGAALRGFFLPHAEAGPIIDGRVMAFTIGVMLVTVVLAGLVPAVQSSSIDVATVLKLGGRESSRARSRKQSVLIAAQVALTLSLLATAMLFFESLRHASAIRLGFDANRLMSVSVDLGHLGYAPPLIDATYDRLRRQALSVPGVASASLVAGTVFGHSVGVQLRLPGRVSTPESDAGAPMIRAATPDYFHTLGEHIVRGRSLTVEDRYGSQRVAVVNQALANLYWPGQDPLGKCFLILAQSACTQVVGVVQNAHVSGLIERPSLQFVVPLAQLDSAGRSQWPVRALVIRTTGHPGVLIAVVQHALRLNSPNLPYPRVSIVADRFAGGLRGWQVGSLLLLTLGALGLLLAAVGLHGLLSYLVARRTRELAVRISLGANPRDMLWLVVRQGFRLTLIGLAGGMVCSVAIAHLIASLLYGVSPIDATSLAAASGLLLVASALAVYFPARRATGVDPMAVLRAE